MNTQRNNNNSKKNLNRRGRGSKRAPKPVNTVFVSKSLVSCFPDSMRVQLRYTAPATQLNQAGFTSASHSYRMNSPYDPDTSVASGSTSGFAEMAAIYSNYRVITTTARVQFLNADAIPMFAAVAFSNLSYSTNSFTYANFQTQNTVVKPLGQNSGADAAIITITRSVKQIIGDAAAVDDVDFTSAVTTNPTITPYVIIAIATGQGAFTLTNGVLARIELFYDTEFFRRQQELV